MEENQTTIRLSELKAEFQRLISFHEISFRDIDAKAKYWLTITLPTFVALTGYLYKNSSDIGFSLYVASYALAANLFVSIFLFSSALGARRVESGILHPKSQSFLDIRYFLESPDRWQELQKDQVEELLRAIGINEQSNSIKSKWLRFGEASLLRGVPTSICIGGGGAFGYSTTCPSGLTVIPTLAGTISGIGVGLIVSTIFVALAHRGSTLN